MDVSICPDGENCTSLNDPYHCAHCLHPTIPAPTPTRSSIPSAFSMQSPLPFLQMSSPAPLQTPLPFMTPRAQLSVQEQIQLLQLQIAATQREMEAQQALFSPAAVAGPAFPQCPYGATCSLLQSSEHRAQYEHPGAARLGCSYDLQCQDNSPAHRAYYSHTCPHSMSCSLLNHPEHCMQYVHAPTGAVASSPSSAQPSACPQNNYCTDLSHDHRDAMTHPCKFGANCRHASKDPVHARRYVHPPAVTAAAVPSMCPQDAQCADTSAPHRDAYLHSCKYHPHCREVAANPTHARRYVHGTTPPGLVPAAVPPLCKAGYGCTDTTAPHLAQHRHFCPQGVYCTDTSAGHLSSLVHPCRDWAECSKLSDITHVQEYVHPCLRGTACKLTRDNNHCDTFMHPCSHGVRCKTVHPLHEWRFQHRCAQLNCPSINDGRHMLTKTHDCPQGGSCSQLADARHVQLYVHPCTNAQPCSLGAAHFYNYAHPQEIDQAALNQVQGLFRGRLDRQLAGAVKVTIELPPAQKQALVNPITDPKRAPSTDVTLTSTGQRGTIAGYELKNQCAAKGTLIVLHHSGGLAAVADSAVTVIASRLHPPWHSPSVRAFRCQVASKTLQGVLNQTICGLSVTFLQVFAEFRAAGYPVFVMGGAVRDALQGNRHVKDIDISFGCSMHEAEQLATRKGWNPLTRSSGLLQLGSGGSGTLIFEGKSIRGPNSDMKAVGTDPKGFSNDLTYECICRDFTVNALYYDPHNDVVYDPSGSGVDDTRTKTLRIPVPAAQWDAWLQGNPSKLLRYWKMISKNYTPDSALRPWVIQKASQGWSVSGGDLRVFNQPELTKLKAACAADMGQAFVSQHLK
eukprot:TRINITY_DN11390_c1_g2_i1.p1 TRINITY_DN11390_c1_g2~~TRINITY_DN11390_c1_g2_i1.p1  ORF type:complete len:851 (-),score=110.38 TRINITY_DN11390_c1_g2_i1:87-2639(-)